MTLTQVWDKPPCWAILGEANNTSGNIGAYFPCVFHVRSGFIRYLFTALHVELKGGIFSS